MFLGMVGCTDFVEVEPPKDTLVAETVFDEASTVRSAMANLFFGMREQGMVSGSFGLTTALGIYADELDYYGFEVQNTEFYQHNLLAGNELVRQWWANGYELIYGANDIIRGVEESQALSEDEKALFTGQAVFVRSQARRPPPPSTRARAHTPKNRPTEAADSAGRPSARAFIPNTP